MDAILTWLQVHILSWLQPPKTIEIIDIIQILLISFVVYRIILWMKNTRSSTLLKGILLIVGFALLANVLQMEVIVWMLGNLSVVAFTAVVIIFQPELRKALEQVGHSNFISSLFNFGRSAGDNKRFSDQTINDLVRASFEMAEVKTGALIVVERENNLEDIEKTGIPVDAILSGQLLINIFEHNTPLHDGAVIIRHDRIAAATCYLPLSQNMGLSKRYGTRHRAAVGISEVTDSLTIIVSEESGSVAYAREGRLYPSVTPSELREQLHDVQKLYSTRTETRRRQKRDKKTAQ